MGSEGTHTFREEFIRRFLMQFLPGVLCGSALRSLLPEIKTGRLHYAATCLAAKRYISRLKDLDAPAIIQAAL